MGGDGVGLVGSGWGGMLCGGVGLGWGEVGWDGWGEGEGLKCAVAADLSLTEVQGVGRADAERAREGLRCAAAADLSRRLGFLVILVPFILHLRVVVIQIHANPLRVVIIELDGCILRRPG